MKLLIAGASPFVRKVRVLIRETGQEDAVEEVPVAVSPVTAEPTAISANPLGKIPALIRKGGPALYDSRVICRFLDAQAGGALYAEARLWETLTLEATADGIMDAAVLMVYQGRFGAGASDWIDGQWDKVARALDAAEQRWMAHLHGPLCAGQIAMGCALGYLDLRHADRDWRAGRPSLAAWAERFAERPSMVETAPS